MAFNRSNAAAAPSASDDSWKASGFINLYLPSHDGKRRKLGAMPLKESKANEKQLLDWLNEDPNRVARIRELLIVEYQNATQGEGSSFALD
jgi:hypothetical protein